MTKGLIALILVVAVPLQTSAGCKEILIGIKNLALKPVFVVQKDIRAESDLPLFQGSARENLRKYIKLLYRSRPIEKEYRSIRKDEYDGLLKTLEETEAGIFDPEFAQPKYGKSAEKVTIEDGFNKLLLLHMERLNNFLHADASTIMNRYLISTERGGKKFGMFLLKAIFLTGLFFTIQGMGAPFWDYVSAAAKRFSFKASSALAPESDLADEPTKDGLRVRLQEQYRKTNLEYSSVEQNANGRVTHVGGTLSYHLGSLNTTKDPELRRAILKEISRLPVRYKDIFESQEGQYARSLFSEIKRVYDPEGEILGNLPKFRYELDGKRSDNKEP